MAYAKDGYPTELANKVGHLRLIQDPMIQRMVECFEDLNPVSKELAPAVSGTIAVDEPSPIDQVITVDGGHQAVPNVARPERQVGFIQVAAQMVKMETISYLAQNPMADPRDVCQMLSQYTHHTLAAIPLTGVLIPGLSVRQSLRECVHRFLTYYELYDALAYLVFRQWQTQLEEPPSMTCLGCAELFELPRNQISFRCPACNIEHKLADYLGLFDQDVEDRSRAEAVSNLRSVLEALVLFSFIIRFQDREMIMNRTLFLLDGPLMLRAQLSRLVEPIRAFIDHHTDQGRALFLVGVEKSGEVRAFADSSKESLRNPGHFFLPDTRFIVEEIHGRSFNETTYRNRVNYGAKVIVRAGPDHVLAVNVPTGSYLLSPAVDDLIGFPDIVRTLSRLLSYSYDNALIPIVLANAEASISNQPSGGLLAQFVDRILAKEQQIPIETR